MSSSVSSHIVLKRLPVGLALAVLLSLMFHFLILGSEYWHFPALDFIKPRVQLQQQVHLLVAAPVPASPVLAPLPKPQPKIERPASPVHMEESLPLAVEGLVPVVVQDTVPLEPVVIDEPEEEQVATDALANENQTTGTDDMVEDTPSQPVFSYVDTEFVVLRGEGGSKIGVTNISYRMQEDGRYVLTSTTEAKGLAALVVSGKLLQQSAGGVTAHGLQPEYFLYQYGKGEGKKQQSRFDWAQHTLTLETAKGVKKVVLPEGAQDILSFMYQFIFVPPLEQMSLSISNGKKLSEYNYSFEGEEVLQTEFGAVRAWHLARAGDDGSEKTELWLAVDYHYLPVKMRKTEEDGSVIEQLATRISTDLLK